MVVKMLQDSKPGSPYKNNVIRQDKLLWIAREYQKQRIKYVEIANTDLAKVGEPAIKLLEEVHEILPEIEKETGEELAPQFEVNKKSSTNNNKRPNNK